MFEANEAPFIATQGPQPLLRLVSCERICASLRFTPASGVAAGRSRKFSGLPLHSVSLCFTLFHLPDADVFVHGQGDLIATFILQEARDATNLRSFSRIFTLCLSVELLSRLGLKAVDFDSATVL